MARLQQLIFYFQQLYFIFLKSAGLKKNYDFADIFKNDYILNKTDLNKMLIEISRVKIS